MTRPALFFDFFGTLVDYIPHNEDRDYPLTMALLRSQGIRVEQQAFLDLLKDTFIAHEQKAIIDDREYAWEDCAFEALRKLTGQSASWATADALTETYLKEWCEDVSPIAGVAEMLARLQEHHALCLITNTHSTRMVHDLLSEFGLYGLFHNRIISSVEYGYRKPSARIFVHAMARAKATPDNSIYIGDTFEADYVGAKGAGMGMLLIDPDGKHDIGDDERLGSILDLEKALERFAI